MVGLSFSDTNTANLPQQDIIDDSTIDNDIGLRILNYTPFQENFMIELD